jgi:MFS family permease
MRSPYVRLLADRRLRGLAAGDLLSSMGDGMAVVAVPWLALQLAQAEHVSEGLAVAAAATAATLLGVPLALAVGLGRRRFDPRSVLLADAGVRGVVFLLLGGLAATGRLALWALVVLLGASSVLHTVAMSARRLILTDLAGPEQRLAVNSLITTQQSIAAWTLGPALGGLLTASVGPATVLAIDGLSFLPLLLAAAPLPPGTGSHGVARGRAGGRSGLAVLGRHPTVVGVLLLTLGVDLLYYPVEVALPVHVAATFDDAGILGAVWTGFGAGAIAGSFLVGLLGRVPRRAILVGATTGWAVALAAFAASRHPLAAVATFAVGGMLWVPFIPVAYTLVQDTVDADEQQPMITLWNAILQGVAPLSLAASGPLVAGLGATRTLGLSAAATLALAAAATLALTVARAGAARLPRRPADRHGG